jgi:hypothetical protein
LRAYFNYLKIHQLTYDISTSTVLHSTNSFKTHRATSFCNTATMPQYHTSTGTYAYADAKSTFPTSPQVSFGRALAIGIGAGALGAFV